MICINCFHTKTSVTNSRPHKKTAQIWRRRQCPACSHIFTTYERPAFHEELTVKNSHGEESMFNFGRLYTDILRCFEPHAQQHFDDAFWLVRSVEDMLVGCETPLATATLKEKVYITLAQFDTVASIQYAAHHRLTDKIRRGRPPKKR